MTCRGAAVLVLVACLLGAPAAHSPLLDDVLEALYNVLRFLLDHPPDLIADTVFGVILAKGQLKTLVDVIQKHPDKHIFQPSRRMYILLATKILEKTSEEIVAVSPSEPPGNSPEYKVFMEKLLQFRMWELHKPMRRDSLRSTAAYQNAKDPVANVSHRRPLTFEEYMTVSRSGSPTETESDTCLVEILNTSSCTPSQECRQIETGGQRPTGYATTHRLLYLQIARQYGCGNSPYFMSIDNWIMDTCAVILKEAEFIARQGVPMLLQDLFIEQITLCGIEGFAEFVRPEWIRKILSLQRSEGCYGDMKEMDIEGHRRVKRYDVPSAHGCMMHVTGLAAAALSLSARALVEMNGLSPVTTQPS